jgi:parallel beta-helix repeat protein/predicted outer membrane repeat protein
MHLSSTGQVEVLLLRFVLLCALILFPFFTLPPQASAASTIIYVNLNASGANNGTSWANAYTNLQTALTGATPPAEIWVAAGTYRPASCSPFCLSTSPELATSFLLRNNVAIYGGFAGNEVNRSQRNWVTHLTILSGDLNRDDGPAFNNRDDNSYRVVRGNGTNSTAILDGFTIRSGNAFVTGILIGAGMYNLNSSPTLGNLIFTDNLAETGGGMYNDASSPRMTNVTFSANKALTGGGMYNNASSPTMSGFTFSNNRAELRGGGMFNFNGSDPSLIDGTFTANVAESEGGGMHNDVSAPMLTNVVFQNNQSELQSGGGMYNYFRNPTLTNVTFQGNQAGANGGAIANVISDPLLTNLVISGNLAANGGGVFNGGGSDPTFTNVTISGNRASSNGGGIYNSDNSNPRIRNTILWNNDAPTGPNTANAGLPIAASTPAYSNSLVQGSLGSSNWVSSFGTNNGGNIDANPLFLTAVSPVNAPTTSGDLRLQPGSPARDSGSNSLTAPTTPTSDIRGTSRPQDSGIDMGAFEMQGLTMVINSGNNQTATVNTGFTTALSVTVREIGGAGLANVTVNFTAPASGASAGLSSPTATTNASGVASVSATANTLTGSYTVNASTSIVASPVSFSLNNTPGSPASLTISGGNNQSAVVNTSFTQQLSTTVRDAFANPVPGVTVNFSVPASGASASLSSPSATTNASGVASVSATANTLVGNYTVSASTSGVPNPISFSLNNTPGSPASLTISGSNSQSTIVNTSFAQPLSITVRDAFTNPVPGVTVNFSVPASGASASLSSPTATTAIDGTASITATANILAGNYTVSASTSGVPNPASFNLSNTPGAPVNLIISGGNSQSTVVNTSFAQPLSVTVRDAFANPVPGATVNFSVPTSGASANLSSPSTITAIDGTASITATANTLAGNYTVSASTSGVPNPTSFSLSNTPGAVSLSESSVTINPPNVAIGTTATISLQARDAFSNPITEALTVTFALGSSGSSNGTIGGIRSLGNGQYTASFTGTVVGSARPIIASINDQPLSSPQPSVRVVNFSSTTSLQSSAAAIVYGQTVTFTATVSSTGVPTGSIRFVADGAELGIATLNAFGQATLVVDGLAAGSYTVSAEYAGNSDVGGSTAPALALSVARAPLRISANNATRQVGTANPAFSVSYNGLVNGETTAVLSGTLAFSTTATLASPVGSYSIIPSGLTSSNYAIEFIAGTLTITAEPVIERPKVFLPWILR